MPRKKNKANKSNRRNRNEPPPTSTSYRGKIVVAAERNQTECLTTTLANTFTVSSNSASAIDLVISADISACSDWSKFEDAWDEVRVLGMRIEFYPNDRYSKTTTKCTPLITVVERQSTLVTPLTSYSTAIAFSSAKKHALEDPWSREVRMQGIEDAGFQSTNSVTAPFQIKMWADSLSASTVYGRFFVYIRAQFRGRR